MNPKNNLEGLRFSRLLVESPAPSRNGRTYWFVVCDCGSRKTVNASHLRSHKTLSCGCRRREIAKEVNTTHARTYHPAYNSWLGMKSRCTLLSNKNYSRYGGRGISVCARWLESFENFWEDMGPTWQSGLSIDRIDNAGNYEPGNCKWSTCVEQNRNRSSNRIIDTPSGPMILVAAAIRYSIHRTTLSLRLKRNLPMAEVFLPVSSGGRHA